MIFPNIFYFFFLMPYFYRKKSLFKPFLGGGAYFLTIPMSFLTLDRIFVK